MSRYSCHNWRDHVRGHMLPRKAGHIGQGGDVRSARPHIAWIVRSDKQKHRQDNTLSRTWSCTIMYRVCIHVHIYVVPGTRTPRADSTCAREEGGSVDDHGLTSIKNRYTISLILLYLARALHSEITACTRFFNKCVEYTHHPSTPQDWICTLRHIMLLIECDYEHIRHRQLSRVLAKQVC